MPAPSWVEGTTYGGVLVVSAWVVRVMRRVTRDTESRATRTVTELEGDIKDLRAEVKECRDGEQAKDRRISRLERALILAGIDLPDP